jgi:hypothetical protein
LSNYTYIKVKSIGLSRDSLKERITMKTQKRTVLFLIIVVIGMGLLCGCEEESLSRAKKGRLVALENMDKGNAERA